MPSRPAPLEQNQEEALGFPSFDLPLRTQVPPNAGAAAKLLLPSSSACDVIMYVSIITAITIFVGASKRW